MIKVGGLKWIPHPVGVVTVAKLSQNTAEKKRLFLAAEYRNENSTEIVRIKKILDAEASTSSSIIRKNLSKAVNETDIIRNCKSPDECSMPVKFNLVLPASAPMAVYDVDYTTYPVENAVEKEANNLKKVIVSALENLNVGEDQTLIENFASISLDELA